MIAIDCLKKVESATARDQNRSHQRKFHGFQLIGKNIDHSDLQDRRRDKSRELQVHLWSSTALNTPLSTMLYNRLLAVLDRCQCADQAGFRNNSKQPDHLVTYKLISQRSREWETDMRVAAMDIKKALDSAQHEAIWRSLRHQSISE